MQIKINTNTLRSENLNLIRRAIIGRHQDTAKKLASVANSNYISQMATGDMAISEHQAREIEKILQLPYGWMDRDNMRLLKIEETEFKILAKLISLPRIAKDGLLNFLDSATK